MNKKLWKMHKLYKQFKIYCLNFKNFFPMKLESRKYVINYLCNNLEQLGFDSARNVIYEKGVGCLAKIRI